MRTSLPLLLALLLLAPMAIAEDDVPKEKSAAAKATSGKATPLKAELPPSLTWPHEGFVAISAAAQEAKAKNVRLLLGLSGGAT